MRKLIFIFSIFTFFSFGQQFENIASINGISMNMSTPDRWGCGMSFYDFDDDGLDDLTFVLQNDSIRFYKNIGNGFIQVGSMIYSNGEMRQLIWVDYNNDGYLDLCATYFDLGIRMYRNDGAFNFSDVTAMIGLTSNSVAYGVSFNDYDKDGDLDLYLANYNNPAYLAAGLISNKLFNYENGSYTDVTDNAGVGNGYQASFIGVWFDYNQDGLTDLYVINDREAYDDALYANNGDGTFTDVAASAGVKNPIHSPMTASISDYDNDNDFDIFLSEIANGNVYQGVISQYNLYNNQGDGTYTDIITSSGLDTNVFAWGGLWVDINNDSYEDIYIATSDIAPPSQIPERSSLLYLNDQATNFVEITDSVNYNLKTSSYCPTKGDINNDGYYDIVVHNDGANPHVLLNSGSTGNNYIKITPKGVINNKRAIGSEIRVYANGQSQLQTVFCGVNYLGQNSQHMIFGVGSSSIVDSVEIKFPNGIIRKEYNLAVNQAYEFEDVDYQYLNLTNDTLTLCIGSSLSIGESGYSSYLWNTGDTTDFINVSSSGTFYFTALLGNNTFIVSDTFNIELEPSPSINAILTQPICDVLEFGEIELLPTTVNDTTYSVIWSNGESGFTLDSLTPGWYSYSLLSQNNCNYQGSSYEIIGSTGIIVEYLTSPQTDTSYGSVQFSMYGGMEPYEILHFGVPVSQYIDTLSSGSYSFTVIDAVGCETDVEVVIQNQSSLSINEISSQSQIYYANQSLTVSGVHELEEIIVYNSTGQKILSSTCFEDCKSIQIELENGIYFALIRSASGTKLDRFFVDE